MIKYQLAAIALKAFSINDATKVAYRKIGNAFGAGRKLNEPYLRASAERGELLVELTQKYGMLTEGSRVLEIGTGWMHWFSVYLRLFREAEFVTYDVWDNRQFQALQGAMAKLKVMLKTSGADSNALLNIEIVQACKSFDELYRRFGMTYVVEPGGSLSMFSDASFDVVMSFHVMEHVYADAVPAVCKGLTRALKPGGYMVHQIGIDDHLTHYDASASMKQYIQYSDAEWRRRFESNIGYINRIQASQWRTAFAATGLEFCEEIRESVPIADLRVNPRFSKFANEDLECTIQTLVFRKK